MITVVTIIFQIILTIILPVLTTLLSYYAKLYINILLSRIENEQLQKTLKEATQIIFNSVNCIQQTYVSELKVQGTFDLGAQQIALAKAKEQAISLMNKEMKQALIRQYGDVDLYMTTLIESIIAENHKDK